MQPNMKQAVDWNSNTMPSFEWQGRSVFGAEVQHSTLWTHYFSEACRQASLLRWALGPVEILCILEGTILALVRKELATCSTVEQKWPQSMEHNVP